MRDNQQIVAGGPWSDLDGGPNRRLSLRLRDAVWFLGAMLALLVVGTHALRHRRSAALDLGTTLDCAAVVSSSVETGVCTPVWDFVS